jgi:hypothetical protein
MTSPTRRSFVNTTSRAWAVARVAAVALVAAGAVACGDESPAVVTTSPSPTLAALVVSQDTPVVPRNGTLRLAVRSRLTDGSGEDVTGAAAWVSSDTQVATVQAGVLTGVAPGSATVTVAYGGLSKAIPVVTRRNMLLAGLIVVGGTGSLPWSGFACNVPRVVYLDTLSLTTTDKPEYYSSTTRTFDFGTTGKHDTYVDPGSYALAIEIANPDSYCGTFVPASQAGAWVEIRDRDTGDVLSRVGLETRSVTIEPGAVGRLGWTIDVGVFK